MKNDNLIQQLMERSLISQITDEKALVRQLTAGGSITLYCGFDPTADSLHLGHLVPLLCLKRFQLAGHRPVALVGGATALIGDPSFKATERKLNTMEAVYTWIENIKRQIALFLDFNCGNNSAVIVNNYDWFSSINMLTFLRDIGKHFSINQMINKEAIKQRLSRSGNGISFTEFSYNLLQAYDFSWLNNHYDVVLQIGGSEQWGNITSGIDLTRRINKKTVYGLTVPLITKADGTKFGKTEDGAVWLDPNKTTPYKFYQFWININDKDVYRFLKFFTFLTPSAIAVLEREDSNSNKVPRAKYVLAEEVTRMVHGEKELAAAKRITNSLFTNSPENLIESDFLYLTQDGIPIVNLPYFSDLQQALIAANLAPSRVQARTMISSNAISVNGKKQVSPKYVFSDVDRIHGRYTLLRRGKKHYCLLRWK